MKNVLLVVCMVSVSGCSLLGEAPAAVAPVADHGMPIAGEALLRLSDAFYALCGREETKRSDACATAKVQLNTAIEWYNRANDTVLEAY